ncbi:molybdenum cofactor guanylyltransferase [Peribacillus sp. SCS-26]|uniref:molybdenum cofactor guanylyltransferase n=1 Tax=Paraperibacillus marinus TaxID=3115295 RepID=UPI003905CF7C
MKIAGIVLAGGRSSRYGKPKMFEEYRGKLLYEYSLDAIKQNELDPVIIAAHHSLIQQFRRDDEVFFVVERESEFQGPLYAMHHAMIAAHADWYLVLSCDIPFVTPEFVRRLLSFIEEGTQAVIPVEGDKIHPLLGLYHHSCIGEMESILHNGERKVRLLFERIKVQEVPFEEGHPVFININRQEDLSRL